MVSQPARVTIGFILELLGVLMVFHSQMGQPSSQQFVQSDELFAGILLMVVSFIFMAVSFGQLHKTNPELVPPPPSYYSTRLMLKTIIIAFCFIFGGLLILFTFLLPISKLRPISFISLFYNVQEPPGALSDLNQGSLSYWDYVVSAACLVVGIVLILSGRSLRKRWKIPSSVISRLIVMGMIYRIPSDEEYQSEVEREFGRDNSKTKFKRRK